MTKHYFTWLALGDSYTTGESVALHESFPYQTIQILRNNGLHFQAPEIVAATGWITLELVEHIIHTRLNESYDFVTLLIGVNNQYRGLSEEDYKEDFEFLLKKAIHFADDRSDHVIVLSLPDWSVTPFAKDRDTKKISEEIDRFNTINEQLSAAYKVRYINITPGTREAANHSELVTKDGLHPSKKEYAKWAQLVADAMQSIIS